LGIPPEAATAGRQLHAHVRLHLPAAVLVNLFPMRTPATATPSFSPAALIRRTYRRAETNTLSFWRAWSLGGCVSRDDVQKRAA